MADEFVSEPIEPEAGGFSPDLMVRGLAALPSAFTWRGRRYAICECLSHEKISSPEGHKSGGEQYLRRQQFRVRLDSGQTATIYVTRQSGAGARGAAARRRWFLYTISSAGPGSGPDGTAGGPGTDE